MMQKISTIALAVLCMTLLTFSSLLAQAGLSRESPVIKAIEPPGWWANMPAAMLLVNGDHLEGTTFAVSDHSLAVSSTKISANGHWAVLHLSASPAQPETIHLLASKLSDHTSADFTFGKRRSADDGFAGFSAKDVMYLIMTDRFADGDLKNDGTPAQHEAELAKPKGWHGGDLHGVTEHLDYLQTLGITTVWITPVYQNHEADSYHGYGATNLYAVDEHYGSLQDLQQLAGELHRRHIKLVLDTVPNHIGPEHPWVADEPEPDWFHGTKADHHLAIGEFGPLVNPHAPWRDQQYILEGWFADILPDMNQENPDAAQYLTQNAIWWIEQTGADGLRIDTFPYVGRPYWHSFHASLHQLYPNLTTVGEIFNGDAAITSAFAGGVARTDLNGAVDTGLSTPFDFPTYFAIRNALLHGKPMSSLADVLRQDSLYPHPERLIPFLGNHDTKRFLGEDGATPDNLKLAFAILLTMRGMPQIYSGDEIAMTGGDDPDNRQNFPGGFAGADKSAFIPAERTPAQKEMYDWVQQLLTLRAHYVEMTGGDEQVLQGDDNVLIYVRGADLSQGCGADRGRMMIALNKSQQVQKVAMLTGETSLAGCTAGRTLLGTLTQTPGSGGDTQLSVPSGASLMYWK